jgi:hypothetical protein
MMSQREFNWARRIVEEMRNLNRHVGLPHEVVLLLKEGEDIVQEATGKELIKSVTRKSVGQGMLL